MIDEGVHVARDRRDLGAQAVVGEGHLRDAPADVGVVAVGAPGLLRRSRLRRRDGQVERAACDAGVDGGQEHFEDAEDAEDDRVGVGPGRNPAHDTIGRGHGPIQHGRARLRAAHADRVPVVTGVDGVGTPHERVDHLRVGRVGGVESVQPQLRPHRPERGEDLGPREGVGAVGGGDGLRVAAEQDQIVARLADAEGEDLAGGRTGLHELQVVDAAVGHHLRHPRPDEVHVDRECRRGGRAREPLLQHRGLRQPEACAAQRGGHEDRQVSGCRQLREILGGKAVLGIHGGGARADALEQVVRQVRGRIEIGHPSILPLVTGPRVAVGSRGTAGAAG